VRITLRSDVPVTLFLSGGIDSSLVAARAVRAGVLQHAYCLDFPARGYSELANAQRVADRLGLKLRRVVLAPEALDEFIALTAHADDPLADSSALAVWTLARAVARDYKVAITGDGGDELFAGYLTYPASRLHGRVLTQLPLSLRCGLARAAGWIPVGSGKVTLGYKLRRLLRAANLPTAEAHFTWNGTWLPEDAANVAGPANGEAARRSLRDMATRHGLSARPSLADLQRADIADYLPNDILAKVDRMTMAHGLESRTPLLHPALVEFALRLPAALKLSPNGQSKWLLRKVTAGLLGQEVANAKKQGFSIPVHQWLRGPARDLVMHLLSPTTLEPIQQLNGPAVIKARDTHLSGRDQLGFELWGLMVLVAWYQARVLDRTAPTCASSVGLRQLQLAPYRN